MKDRFVLRYSQGASKQVPSARAEGAIAAGHPNGPKHRLLHDHRSDDALLEYLDNLEE